MLNRTSIAVIAAAVAGAIAMSAGGVRAAEYPNWKGQWERFIGPGLPGRNGSSHDQTRPPAYGQQAPLTPEYAAVLDASIADQVNGGLGNSPTSRCFPAGMPRWLSDRRNTSSPRKPPTF